MWSLVSRPGAIFTTGHLVILIWPPKLDFTLLFHFLLALRRVRELQHLFCPGLIKIQ